MPFELPFMRIINAFRTGGFRGGATQAWNGSMPGRVVNGIRGIGNGVQGDAINGFLGRGTTPGGTIFGFGDGRGGLRTGSGAPPSTTVPYGSFSGEGMFPNPPSTAQQLTPDNSLGIFPNPEAPPNSDQAVADSGTIGWINWLNRHANPGGFQGGGLGQARPVDRVATGAIGNMGGSSTNPLLSGNTSGGLGGLMMGLSPLRQSGGVTFNNQLQRV